MSLQIIQKNVGLFRNMKAIKEDAESWRNLKPFQRLTHRGIIKVSLLRHSENLSDCIHTLNVSATDNMVCAHVGLSSSREIVLQAQSLMQLSTMVGSSVTEQSHSIDGAHTKSEDVSQPKPSDKIDVCQ